MDIWQSGRRELFGELGKLCDRIGSDLAAELDHDNSVLIPCESLRALREQAGRADELEEKVLKLVRDNRAQEARLNEAGTLRDKNEEIYRLVEDNARISEELETYKAAALKVHDLEKENKRLKSELQQTLRQSRDNKTVGGPLSSELQIDGDQPQSVTKEMYQSLVKKFNKLYENHIDTTMARERMERSLNAKKEQMHKYQKYYDHLEKKVKKRDAKIEEQDEELRRLKVPVQGMGDKSHFSDGLEITPKMRYKQECEGQSLKNVAAARHSALLSTISCTERVLSSDDIVPAIDSPILNKYVAATWRHFQESKTSPEKDQTNLEDDEPLDSIPVGSGYLELVGPSCAPEKFLTSRGYCKDQYGRTNIYGLPLPASARDKVSDDRAAGTEFKALEPLCTSSVDATSPENAGAVQPQEQPSVVALPSPDTPTVISSKSVRKRKGQQHTTEPSDIPKVKVETISSSPIGLAAFHALDDSLDLDDIGDKQMTPRKLQKALRTGTSLANAAKIESQGHEYSHPSDTQKLEHVSQVTPIRRTGVSRTGSVLQTRSPNVQMLPRTSVDRAPKRRKTTSENVVNDVIEDGQVIESIEMSSRKKTTLPSEQAQLLNHLLTIASPQKHDLDLARPTGIQRKPRHARAAPALSDRAYEFPQGGTHDNKKPSPLLPMERMRTRESSESSGSLSREDLRKPTEISRPLTKDSLRSSQDPSRPHSKSVLMDSAYSSKPASIDSLEGYMGSPKPLKLISRTIAEFPGPRDLSLGSTEPQRSLYKDSTRQSKFLKSTLGLAQPCSREQIITSSRDSTRPLRTRTLNELTLQDFKVNPEYNQGYNYAFSDVVRNQAERRCLQGCTKPECCGGKFRALAVAARNPDQPLTMSQEEADRKLLEEFLGDNIHKLSNMTKAEREETLLQARARDMSNKFGKHRHAYERRQSPPGYWRSDFPDTQEEIQDRAKAAQMERDQIAQRYEAAMRPGGPYMFRDE